MGKAVTNNEFVYSALENGKEHIRLLRIHQSGKNGPLNCSLHVFALKYAPLYAAVSYVWGPPSPTESITVDGAPFRVRSNCFYALKQASRARHCIKNQPYLPKTAWKYFWLDAICIDQTNIDEKSQHVAIMYDIFNKASIVLSSVGTHSDDSEFLFNTLRFPFHLSILERCRPAIPFQWQAMRCPMQKRCSKHLAAVFKKGGWERLKQAMIAFGSRVYWTRVWIAQEIHGFDRVSLMCGNSFLWAGILSIWTLGARDLNLHLQDSDPQPKFSWRDFQTPMLDFFPLRQGEVRKLVTYQMSLSLAMMFFHQRECSDPRDRIYGVLRLIAWPGGQQAITPDYGKTRLEVALDIIGCYAGQEDPEGTLCVPLAIDTFRAMQLENDQKDIALLVDARRRQWSSVQQTQQPAGICHAIAQSTSAIKDYGNCHATVLEAGDRNSLRLPWNLWNSGDKTPRHESSHCPSELKGAEAGRGRPLRLGSAVVGYVCSHAQPGDLLVALHRADPFGPMLWLILRHQPLQDIYEIIGQAVVHKTVLGQGFLLIGYCGKHCEWGGDHKMPGLKLVQFHLDSTDLIALAAQLELQKTDVDGMVIEDDVQWDLLDMSLTTSSNPLSSYAVELSHTQCADSMAAVGEAPLPA